MSNVIGTIISVNEFLKSDSVNISIRDKKGEYCDFFTLKEERKYMIPSYQRELRWDEKQIKELIYDVINGKQFLGNIIVSERTVDSYTEYEIIDGQQRITALRMIVKYIFETHTNPSSLEKYRICDLIINSFRDYTNLEQKSFDITHEDRELFKKTDDYHRMDSYIHLWKIIGEHSSLRSNEQKRVFLTKLDECYLNLIIVDRKHIKLGIEYFVDVNQKGVKLDPEDTLKGYLFQYNSLEMQDHWAEIKKICFEIIDDYKCKYSLLLLFEQYYYCTLYKDAKYKSILLKQDFSLKEDFVIKNEQGQIEKEFSKGTHLIQALRDHRDILQDICQIKKVATLILQIVKETTITRDFTEKYINPALLTGEGKISDDELQCIYYMLRQIMLDTNEVPKALVVNYIIDVLLNESLYKQKIESLAEKKQLKHIYQSVYTMYILYTLFALFVGKKNRERIYSVLKEGNYEELMTAAIRSILNEKTIVGNQKSIAYKTFSKSISEDPRKDAFRCKAVATLYNYMYFDTNRNIYTFNRHGELADFLLQSERYSLEHFLLNSQLKCRVYLGTQDQTVSYDTSLYKFVGSMFNFIFINEKVNNTVLDNRNLLEKIEILRKEGKGYDSLTDKQKRLISSSEVECNYSKMALKLFFDGKCFVKYMKICADQNKSSLENYFATQFVEEYSQYVDMLTESFLKQITCKQDKG